MENKRYTLKKNKPLSQDKSKIRTKKEKGTVTAKLIWEKRNTME